MEPIKKKEGFREQRLFVLPEYMQMELAGAELTRQLFVSDIGFFPHAKHHYRERPEGIDAHIFIYCIEGEGFVERAGEISVSVPAGSLVIIPAGIPHRYWASEQNPWSIYWFHLKGEHTGELTHLYGLENMPKKLPAGFSGEFIARIDQSLAIIADRPYSLHSHVYVSQTMRWLISGLGQELLRSDQDRKRDRHLDNAIRYMTEHVATSIQLPDLAKSTGLSSQHVNHLFKKETGFSPIDYFLRMKMQHAANMLDLTGLTVKEIAASVGMNDPYYFSRMFKKLMGQSPTEYRNIPKG
ncbi:AraC family transcriptional regulator [Gorillibacterium massiliense]|uniref:AraC family transcriptional regulator n=1 Tax=Gorillibacterium massiliense TaxID=1280390 RepID=UPI0004B48051|nr:AraC family transcriptional regulator [Gorillibacterium massiliense]